MALLALNSQERGVLEGLITPLALTNEVRVPRPCYGSTKARAPKRWPRVYVSVVKPFTTGPRASRGDAAYSTSRRDSWTKNAAAAPGLFPLLLIR